jgi:hypothetical protein
LNESQNMLWELNQQEMLYAAHKRKQQMLYTK